MPGPRRSISRKDRDGKQAQANGRPVCPASEAFGRGGRDDLVRVQFDRDRDHRWGAGGVAVCGAPLRAVVLPLSQDGARDRPACVCVSRPSIPSAGCAARAVSARSRHGRASPRKAHVLRRSSRVAHSAVRLAGKASSGGRAGRRRRPLGLVTHVERARPGLPGPYNAIETRLRDLAAAAERPSTGPARGEYPRSCIARSGPCLRVRAGAAGANCTNARRHPCTRASAFSCSRRVLGPAH